jgi:hypothetical protein
MFFRSSLLIFIALCFSVSAGFAASVDLRLNINFKTNEAIVDKDGQEVVRKLYVLSQKYPETKLLISGHTDSIGSDDFNMALSLRRAEAIEASLLGKGLIRERMVVKGFGETAPLVENDSVENRFKNRRVVGSFLGLTDEEKEMILAGDNKDDVIEESGRVSEFKKTIKVTRKERRAYITGFVGPHWSAVYYGGAIDYEHSELTPISFGIDAGYKLSSNWFVDGYFYYLPTTVAEGNSGIDFLNTDVIDYENNIYGLRIGRYIKKASRYRLSVIGGVSSHILGAIKRTSATDFSFSKFQHIGLTMGVRHEQRITGTWVFDSDLAYILPISVDNVESFSGRIWWRGILGVKKRLTKRLRLGIEYQAVYHESEFNFAPGITTTPEFFIQTLMFGLKYNF